MGKCTLVKLLYLFLYSHVIFKFGLAQDFISGLCVNINFNVRYNVFATSEL